MKVFKSFIQRFKLFRQGQNQIQQQNGDSRRFLPFLTGKLGSLLKGEAGFRLIAPINNEKLGLPQGESFTPSAGTFGKLSSFGSGSQSIQIPEIAAFESSLRECNYQLLFKGAPPLHLKAIQSWSDIPLLAPIKDALSKALGSILSPLQKVCLPSLLSGEDHVIQNENVKTATILFLIPAFMQLLQLDETTTPQNEVKVLILAKDDEQVKNVNQEIKQLQGIFGEGFKKADQFTNHILVDTPKNVLENVKENKVNLSAVKYFVVSDLTAMQNLGLAQDIVAVSSYVSSERQTVVVSSKINNDSLVIDQLMINFKHYVFVLSQYAAAFLQEYALRASILSILLLLGAVGYLSYKLRNEKQQQIKSQKK